MQQSGSRVSRGSKFLKVAFAALIGVAGLTVVGVDSASAAVVAFTGIASGSTGGSSCAPTPLSGTANGGSYVTVCGGPFGSKLLPSVTNVTVGGIAPTSVVVNSNTSMTLILPPAAAHSAAVVGIQFTTTAGAWTCPAASGAATLPCQYTYTWAAPTVAGTGLAAATAAPNGAAGNPVTITAAGTWSPGQLVSLSGFAKIPSSTYTIITGGTGSFTVPFAAGLFVADAGAVSPSLAGAIGPIAGLTPVIVAGTNLAGATSVKFGSKAATSFTQVSATVLSAVAPSGTAGPVDVTVVNPSSATPSRVSSASDTFTYVDAPTVTSVSGVGYTATGPTGPTGGGTQVTIAGTGFTAGATVSFGGNSATNVLINSLTSITATSPAGAGTVDVRVTTTAPVAGQSPVNAPADQFTYNPTMSVANGTAAYSNSPGTTVVATATSQTGAVVTVTAPGSWSPGSQVVLSGFTNGLSSTPTAYTIDAGVLNPTIGSFTIPFAPAISNTGGGNVLTPDSITNTAPVTAVSQVGGRGTDVTISAVGAWSPGQQLYFNGIAGILAGNYAVKTGGSGTFTVAYSGTATPCSTTTTACATTATVVPYQVNSFNALTLVTGGGTINNASLTITTPPTSGTLTVQGTQLLYEPAQTTPVAYTNPTTTAISWGTSVTTTGTQTAAFQICDTAPTCHTGTITYLPAGTTGQYVGNQLKAAGLSVSIVEDTGAGVSTPATVPVGGTFTSVTAPTMAGLPSTNSGQTVIGIGGYQSITPVDPNLTLVPGSLTVSGGDTATASKFTATLCTSVMGYVAGTCTAHMSTPDVAATGTSEVVNAGPPVTTTVTVAATGQWADGQMVRLHGFSNFSDGTYAIATGGNNSFAVTFSGTVTGTSTGTVTNPFQTTYPYIETSLNVGTLIPGGSQLSLPTTTAKWTVSGPVGTTYGTSETEFVATTNVLNIGVLPLDAYPTNLASFLNQGQNAPIPDYTAPTARWTVTAVASGPSAPVITSANAATFSVGAAGTFTVTASGSPAPTFTETGALPTGVTLNPTTGVLSGTPATGTANTYPITITAANGTLPNGTQSFTLTVGQAPVITSATSATFTVGTAGTFTVAASGTPAPTFSEIGALPSGVTLNATTGVLSGTPATGTGSSYPITITAANGALPDGTQAFTLTVDEGPAITSPTRTTFTLGAPGTFTVTASGYPAPTFSETGALPSGVTLNATTGVLSGTPATAGPFAITITATNGTLPDGTQAFTLTVTTGPVAPVITSLNSATFTVGTAGTFTVTASGSPAPTFSEAGALPSGVTLNTTTGVLSGTPATGTGGTYPITITAANGTPPNGTQAFTLTVDEGPAITSANATTFTVGAAGTFTVTAFGYPAPTFSETGALPSGVTLNTTTGVLSGTPVTGTDGTYPFTITAANGMLPDGTQAFTLTVVQPTAPAPPVITNVTTGDGLATVTWTPGSDGGSPITGYTAYATPVLGSAALLVPGTLSCTAPASATSCTIIGLVNGTTYSFSVIASNAQGPGQPSNTLPGTPSANGPVAGTWMVTSAGGILTNGKAVSYGSAAGLTLNKPIVAMAPTPDRKGYWLVATDGGVFSYGDATFFGSTGGMQLNAPIVGMASTSDGKGYWLVASDGGVFAYGDAGFQGSMGGKSLNAPIVGMSGNGTGGYLLVASDGGIFAFGSAPFFGSAGNLKLVSPVVGIATAPGGSGYYLAAADGGVFSYGTAPFFGSGFGVGTTPVVGIATGAGGGYTLATSTGGAYNYGVPFFGSQAGTSKTAPVIGIAA